jgi:hypothetical protein
MSKTICWIRSVARILRTRMHSALVVFACTRAHPQSNNPARTSPTTDGQVIEEIDRLLGDHTHEEIVEILNARGFRSGNGWMFNLNIVGRLCNKSGLKSRRQRLREAGLLTRIELARKLKVTPLRIIRWRLGGRINGHRSNYKTEFLYQPLSENVVAKLKSRKQNEKTLE